MGDAYKRWFPRLRMNEGFEHKLPLVEPPLHYPVYWTPENAATKTYPFGRTGRLPWTDGPAGPMDGESPFQKRRRLLKLPRSVVVINGCQLDKVFSANPAEGFFPPTFPDTAHEHYKGLGAALYAALKPHGIMVYQVNGPFADWAYPSMPYVPPEDHWIGGDAFHISVMNESLYKEGHSYVDLFLRTSHGSDAPTYELKATGPTSGASAHLDVQHDGFALSPVDNWAELVRRFRNWHGLACGVPWDGDTETYFYNSNFLSSQFGLPDPASIGGGVYQHRWRLDLEDADLATTLPAGAAAMNAASPDVPGDASWEYVAVGATQSFTFFVDRAKAWFGVD